MLPLARGSAEVSSATEAATSAAITSAPGSVDAASTRAPEPPPSPSVGEPGRSNRQANPLNNVYFGEQHMHTQNSFDGFTIAPHQTWEAAYRYGMGEPITLESAGITIQRRTPYDFVAITDHSEYYGVLKQLTDPNDPLSKSEFAQGFTRGILGGDKQAAAQYVTQLIGTLLTNSPISEYVTPDLLTGNWAKFVETADRFNKPGEFTALYAYEWTSIPNGQNMHRNVFFRGKVILATSTTWI